LLSIALTQAFVFEDAGLVAITSRSQSTGRCDPLILYAVWIDLRIGYMSETVLMEHLHSVGEILSMTTLSRW